jgi:hypothetical protein
VEGERMKRTTRTKSRWLRYKYAFSSKQSDGANQSVRPFLFWSWWVFSLFLIGGFVAELVESW